MRARTPIWSDVALRCLKAASIHSLAVITYCCLFGLISLLTSRALIVGILYAGFFEGLLANLPFNIRLATVIYYTRLIAYRSMRFVTTFENGKPDHHERHRRQNLAAQRRRRPRTGPTSANPGLRDGAIGRQPVLRGRRRGPLLAARVLRQDAREDVTLAILDFGLPILDSFRSAPRVLRVLAKNFHIDQLNGPCA